MDWKWGYLCVCRASENKTAELKCHHADMEKAKISIMNYSKLSGETRSLSSLRWLCYWGSVASRNSVSLKQMQSAIMKERVKTERPFLGEREQRQIIRLFFFFFFFFKESRMNALLFCWNKGYQIIQTLCIQSCFFWSPEYILIRCSCEFSLNWKDFKKTFQSHYTWIESPEIFPEFSFSKAAL